MILHHPFEITSRLLPGVKVGDAWVQLEYATRAGDEGRQRYRWTIDLPDGSEFSEDDLQSGCNGGTLQGGFASLVSFLYAAGESYGYQLRTGREGDNSDLFPPAVVEWAYGCSDELSMLSCELEEGKSLIEE